MDENYNNNNDYYGNSNSININIGNSSGNSNSDDNNSNGSNNVIGISDRCIPDDNNNDNNSYYYYNNSDNEFHSDTLHTLRWITQQLNYYYIPFILTVGTLGNTLSVIVFFKTKLNKLSSTYYLAALAISDNCFLFGSFIQWLNFWDIHLYHREYFCQCLTFLTNLASFCSSWFVVAFTVERFIAVIYPLKRQFVCTLRRAKFVLLCITLFGIIHCIPFLISSAPICTHESQTEVCGIRAKYKYYMTRFNYWDTVIVYAVPFIIITVLNCFTAYTVWKFATVRGRLTKSKKRSRQLPANSSISSSAAVMPISDNSFDDIKLRPYKMIVGATTNPKAVGAVGTTGIAKTTKTASKLSTSSSSSLSLSSCLMATMTATRKDQQDYQEETLLPISNSTEKARIETAINQNRRSGGGGRKLTSIVTTTKRATASVNSSQLKVTKMLLLVSTVFICLNLPSCITRIKAFIETESSPASKSTTTVLQYIFNLLLITNFSINFILYCISGQNFRKALLNLFRRKCNGQIEAVPQLTVSEYFRTTAGTGTGAAAINSNASCNNTLNSTSNATSDYNNEQNNGNCFEVSTSEHLIMTSNY